MIYRLNFKRLIIVTLLLVSLSLAIGACGPATDAEPQDSAGQETGASGESLPGEDEGRLSEAAPPLLAPASGNSEPIVQVTGGEGANNLNVDRASVEEDARGLTVGFTADGHAFRGDPDAPVVIEEFSDFQCPFCERFHNQTLPSLLDNEISAGDAVIVFKDFPLENIHTQARPASNAARCAGDQGAAAFWGMHDRLFAAPSEWSNANHKARFTSYAEELGLDVDAFETCFESGEHDAKVQADLEDGYSRGVTGTPSFFVNGQILVGAQPLSVFNAAIIAVKEGGSVAVTDSQRPQQQQQPSAAPTPATLSAEFAGALGDPSAPVTIVEYTDYQCPYCARHSLETLQQIRTGLVETGRVYYILKDLPLDNLHPNARGAAAAARCAGEQGAYWEMHDALFESQDVWAPLTSDPNDAFADLADSIGIDGSELVSCLNSGRHDAAVESNTVEARSLGVSGTPHFFIDGYPLNGARPYEHFEIAVQFAEQGRLAELFTPQEQPEPSGPVVVNLDNAYSIGSEDAPITIVEFTDYQCPYCARHNEQTYPSIVQDYVNEGIVRYVFKDFPLNQIHPQAAKAAEAARCAGEQDSYVEMHDLLFERQQQWGTGDPTEILVGYAAELNLNADDFEECLTSDRNAAAVNADLQEGISLGIGGTPTFFINGYMVEGAQSLELFEQAIASLLEQSEQ